MPSKKAAAGKKKSANKKTTSARKQTSPAKRAKAPAKRTTSKKKSAVAKKKAAFAKKKVAAEKRTSPAKKAVGAKKKSAKKKATSKVTKASSKNKRRSPKKRAMAAHARTVSFETDRDYEAQPRQWLPDRIWVKFVLALFLLPICFATSEAAFGLIFFSAKDSGLWSSPQVWSFSLGAAVWLAVFVWLKRPLHLYVFGHEATHAVVAFCCGASVPRFNASPEGGYIYTTKTNFLISLAPYLIPFYTAIVLAASVFLTFFFDVYEYRTAPFFGLFGFRWIWVIMALVGLTWSFHLTFTVWMIGKDQPDLIENGVFFSLVLIYLANLLLICALLLLASPDVDFAHFRDDWMQSLGTLADYVRKAFVGIVWLLERAFEVWRPAAA